MGLWTTVCASRALTASIWLKTAQRGLSVQFLGVASPTAFYSMGPEESWIVAIVADGRNARMKDILSVLQSVLNAEIVEWWDTSIGVARTVPSCQFLCNPFHTLTRGTQGCSCSTPLTAWRMKRKWTTCCPRFQCKNCEGVCLCRIVTSSLRGSKLLSPWHLETCPTKATKHNN